MEHFLKISLTHIFYAWINYFQLASVFLPRNSENESESGSAVSDSLQPDRQFVEFSRPEYWSG